MVEQLRTVGRVRDVTNIRNFIKLLGEEVEDLTKDFIEHVAELYVGPDRDIEIDEDNFV